MSNLAHAYPGQRGGAAGNAGKRPFAGKLAIPDRQMEPPRADRRRGDRKFIFNLAGFREASYGGLSGHGGAIEDVIRCTYRRDDSGGRTTWGRSRVGWDKGEGGVRAETGLPLMDAAEGETILDVLYGAGGDCTIRATTWDAKYSKATIVLTAEGDGKTETRVETIPLKGAEGTGRTATTGQVKFESSKLSGEQGFVEAYFSCE
jgi:hypothetical protein